MKRSISLVLVLSLLSTGAFAHSRHHHRYRSHAKASEHVNVLDSYPLPERNWIKSGMWKYVGSEYSNVYHRPDCPLARAINPRLLVGFSSAEDARSQGRVPDKVCHPFDPDATPDAQAAKRFEQANEMEQAAAAYAASGMIPTASDLHSGAQILRGDALMILADYEKARGRTDNARALYVAATAAYTGARTGLPPGALTGGGATAGGGGAGGDLARDFGIMDMAKMGNQGYSLNEPVVTMGF